MKVLTKQDLQDWNSHPVTQQIFATIKEELSELKSESCMCATSDETAMKVSFNEGVAQGVDSLTDAYEVLAEASE